MGKNNTADAAHDLDPVKLDDRSLAEGLLLGRRLGVSLFGLASGDKRRYPTKRRQMDALALGTYDPEQMCWVLDPAETASYLRARHGEKAPNLAGYWDRENARRPFDYQTQALVRLDLLSPGELLWLRQHGAAQGHVLYAVDRYGRGATQYAIGDALPYDGNCALYLAHASITAAYHAAYREHLRGRCLGGDATAQVIEGVCDVPELTDKEISDAFERDGFFGAGSESRWKAWADPTGWQALVAKRETELRAEIHKAQERLAQVVRVRGALNGKSIAARATERVEALVAGTTPPSGLPKPLKKTEAA
jgi:hypothetical protein